MRHVAPRFASGHEHSAAVTLGNPNSRQFAGTWSEPRLNLKQKSSPVCPESAKNSNVGESDSLLGLPLQRQRLA